MRQKVAFCAEPGSQTKLPSISHFRCFCASNDTGQKKKLVAFVAFAHHKTPLFVGVKKSKTGNLW